MKIIKYQLCTEVNRGTEEQPDVERIFSTVSLGWSEANEKIAKREAYNGEYTIEDDGEPEPVMPPTAEELAVSVQSLQSAASIAFVTLCETGSIDAATAAEHVELFAEWAYPVAYKAGQIRRYADALYKCVQAHTSQETWTPDVSSSLWSKTSDPAEEWPAWAQPVGAYDAYAKGDKVSHNGKHWTSDADGNVWEPGVYGWTEVTT